MGQIKLPQSIISSNLQRLIIEVRKSQHYSVTKIRIFLKINRRRSFLVCYGPRIPKRFFFLQPPEVKHAQIDSRIRFK